MADWKKLLDDAMGQLGGAAQAAGQGLRQAGKVVGIGVGALELRPARTTYALGQTIRGVVELQLAEPVAARRLVVTLRATRKRTVNRRGHGPTTETEVVHEFALDLAGEQTYESGEHEFAVTLPDALESQVDVGGFLGDVLKVSRAFRSMGESPLRWRLVATLEIPWKRNLSKAVDLHVREAPGDEDDEPPPPPRAQPRPRPEAAKAEAAKSQGEAAKAEAAKSQSASAAKAEAAKSQSASAAKAEAARSQSEAAKAEAAKSQSASAAKAEAAKSQSEAAKGEAAKSQSASAAKGEAASSSPAPAPVPEPIALPGGWMTALSQTLCALQGRGWVIIHHWAGPPARPEAVLERLARHPDLDPEILHLHGVMDGLELVVGKPIAPRADYAAVRLARELAGRRGGRLGALAELPSQPELAAPLAAEFVTTGDDAVRVLELPTLARLLDDGDDFTRRDGRTVIFGAAVRGRGDRFGLTRADEIARWRAPAAGASPRAGYYDHCAHAYQARLRERASGHPNQVWWVVRGEDHGARLREPAVLLRWSEMLALCLHELERGAR